jgi:biopolymer transport protein ExbB
MLPAAFLQRPADADRLGEKRPDTKPARSSNAQPEAAKIDLQELFRAGGVIGIIILTLSIAMVALIIEHLLSIRRNALMPPGLAQDVQQQIQLGKYQQAHELCQHNPSLLGHVLSAGLAEVALGYQAVEKSMEDASMEQSARLSRKIEYLSVIGQIAPMLGLLGTVWGMILAFLEFSSKANPQVSELAPGISKALVTTLMGLSVAVPAFASFAIFRNRIDELVAESSLLAEHVFSGFKRSIAAERTKRKPRKVSEQVATRDEPAEQPRQGFPPVTIEREPRG